MTDEQMGEQRMDIRTRLKKMESSLKVADDLCRCPDALALAATPYFRTCYRCEKTIDITTWKHWQMCNPDENNNFFAFGLKRDDGQELTDRENDYYQPEVIKILRIWEQQQKETKQK
jgi:hypothetical protein